MTNFYACKFRRTDDEAIALRKLYNAFGELQNIEDYELGILREFSTSDIILHSGKEQEKTNGEFWKETRLLMHNYNRRLWEAIEDAAKEYAKAIWDREGYEVKLVPKNEGGNKND